MHGINQQKLPVIKIEKIWPTKRVNLLQKLCPLHISIIINMNPTGQETKIKSQELPTLCQVQTTSQKTCR